MAQGYAADFEDDSEQYASIGNDLGVGGGAVTLSLWVKFESFNASTENAIMEVSDAATFVQYRLHYSTASGNHLKFTRNREWVSSVTADYTVTLSTGVWYHIVGTCDSSGNIQLFLDGSSVATNTGATGDGSMTSSDHATVAVYDASGGSTFTPTVAYCSDGVFDDAIFFNADIGDTRAGNLHSDPCNPDLTNAVARYEFENNLEDSVATFDMSAANGVAYVTTGLPYTCGISISVSDQLNVSESVSLLLLSNISVSDQLNVSESVTVFLPFFNVNVSDQITVSESVTMLTTLFINTSDEITLTEEVTATNAITISVSDELTVSESVTVFLPFFNVSVSDQLNLTESATVDVGITINVSDEITLSESTSQALLLTINVSDELSVSESTSTTVTIFISVSDQLTVSESTSLIVSEAANGLIMLRGRDQDLPVTLTQQEYPLPMNDQVQN